jgi:hypothetical protein
MLPNYFFSRKAWSRLSINFIKWSIPGTIAIVLLLIIVLISLLGEDGSLLGIGTDINYPKGILSFMSIAMIISGILGFLTILKFHIREVESLLQVIGFGLVCMVIGFFMLNGELKRLHQL